MYVSDASIYLAGNVECRLIALSTTWAHISEFCRPSSARGQIYFLHVDERISFLDLWCRPTAQPTPLMCDRIWAKCFMPLHPRGSCPFNAQVIWGVHNHDNKLSFHTLDIVCTELSIANFVSIRYEFNMVSKTLVEIIIMQFPVDFHHLMWYEPKCKGVFEFQILLALEMAP